MILLLFLFIKVFLLGSMYLLSSFNPICIVLSHVDFWYTGPASWGYRWFYGCPCLPISVIFIFCIIIIFFWFTSFGVWDAVVGCNKLKDTEWISRQDPYVCLEYGSTKFRTRTCTGCPLWLPLFYFFIFQFCVCVCGSTCCIRPFLWDTDLLHIPFVGFLEKRGRKLRTFTSNHPNTFI